MKKFSYMIIILAFAASAYFSWNSHFRDYWTEDTVDIHTFPRTIGEWQSEDLPISDDELAILETDNVFVRRYFDPAGKEVYLFIVYSENNRKVSHPPEICYTGAGATILDTDTDTVSGESLEKPVDVNTVLVEQGREKQIFYYWFKVGDTYTPSYWKQQGLIALKSFLGQPASSALIRVSSTIENENKQQAIQEIKEFSRLIQPHLEQHLL